MEVRTVCLELSQPVAAEWLAKELGPGAWFHLESHSTVVSPWWRILIAHSATVERILDLIEDRMAQVKLHDLPPEVGVQVTWWARPGRVWKTQSGVEVVRGTSVCVTAASTSVCRNNRQQLLLASSPPLTTIGHLKEEVAQLRAELVIIPGLRQEIAALTALVNALWATLAKVRPDLQLDVAHAPAQTGELLAPWAQQAGTDVSVTGLTDIGRDSLFSGLVGPSNKSDMERDASWFLKRDLDGDFDDIQDSGTVRDFQRDAKEILQQ